MFQVVPHKRKLFNFRPVQFILIPRIPLQPALVHAQIHRRGNLHSNLIIYSPHRQIFPVSRASILL